MIVSFSVSNYRSFLAEETLSLVASNRFLGSHEEHAVPIPNSKERVLRAGVLYGANGAGKSNLFKALRYLKSIALEPRKKNSGTGREIFRFADVANEPSSFDLQFIAGDKIYRFGFKAHDQWITEEWLLEVVGGRERTIYERITDEHGKVIVDARGLEDAGEKVRALATVGGPQNQSFLATTRATLDASDIGSELRSILSWLEGSLFLIAPDTVLGSLGHLLTNDPDLRRFAGDFLKSSSTGVDHLEVQRAEFSEDDLRGRLPANYVSDILEAVREDGEAAFREGEAELLVERAGDKLYRLTIQTAHEHQPGKMVPLDLMEESDGTRRLLNLIPALHQLRTESATCFIDEIDRSMHPMLIWKFLEFFLKACGGTQGQLIVTTHESNLLDLDLLRRDEIWFAEKDQSGATRLYSMADFKVRKDLEIRKHYLQGRFGAVPFLGDLDRLLAEKAQPR